MKRMDDARRRLTYQQPLRIVAKTSTGMLMRIFKKSAFDGAARLFPNDAANIDATYRLLSKSNAHTSSELKQMFNTLDRFTHRHGWYVIDISGNNLRLIAAIDFIKQLVFVKHIYTHAEYTKANKWYHTHRTGIRP
jgi:mRNA interferase HigB